MARCSTRVRTYGAVAVEVPVEGELAPGAELAAGARAVQEHRGGRLLLHPDADRARVVLEDILHVGGPVAAAGRHAVEPLGVAARVVVDLELVVAADLQLVGDGPHLDRVQGRLDGLQVLAGQLEAVIPEAILPGTEDLRLLPAVDAILGPGAPLDRLVDQRGRARHVGMALGRVGDHHLVRAIAVREEIKDPLFLHEPAGERRNPSRGTGRSSRA